MELTPYDLRYVVTRLPRDCRDLLSAMPKKLFVAGGFVRATIAGEMPNDIDFFSNDVVHIESAVATLCDKRPGSKTHRTKNAITVLSPDRLPVQFITRWLFDDPMRLIDSFDYTVCQAAIWRDESESNSAWRSRVADRFYIDLAGRRLNYTSPCREEEAGGSLLRAIKFVKRGYTIQVDSLGRVVARLAASVRESGIDTEQVIVSLLREVDPLFVIDGEFIDDHDTSKPEDT